MIVPHSVPRRNGRQRRSRFPGAWSAVNTNPGRGQSRTVRSSLMDAPSNPSATPTIPSVMGRWVPTAGDGSRQETRPGCDHRQIGGGAPHAGGGEGGLDQAEVTAGA